MIHVIMPTYTSIYWLQVHTKQVEVGLVWGGGGWLWCDIVLTHKDMRSFMLLMHIQECRNPCCNATTCMLADGADCGEGQCCENCQFRAYGTTCREAMGECDTLEYCSGDSPDCPADLHIQDGQSCSNNQSYCFSGLCRSHDQQCRLHWGSGT